MRPATGSNSHGGDIAVSNHVLLSPLFAPAAKTTLLPRPPPLPLEEPARAKRKRGQPGNPGN